MFKRSVKITRITKEEKSETEDVVLIESPIDLYVNSEPLVNIICLPKDLKELGVGFLYSIGIINSIDDIKEIKVDEIDNKIYIELEDSLNFLKDNLEIDGVSRVVDTTCGIASPWRFAIKKALDGSAQTLKDKTDLRIKKELIHSALVEMQKETVLFRETGACHGAAIFDFNGNLLAVKEDIGRHNAIDKVIGDLILKKTPFDEVFLTSTGRLTGDSVLKAIRANIPIMASLSAPVESGIKLAFAYGLTLIGFARGAKMNIYSFPDRIV